MDPTTSQKVTDSHLSGLFRTGSPVHADSVQDRSGKQEADDAVIEGIIDSPALATATVDMRSVRVVDAEEQKRLNEALIVAVRTDDTVAVQQLLIGGADVNTRDHDGQNPLIMAAFRCKLDKEAIGQIRIAAGRTQCLDFVNSLLKEIRCTYINSLKLLITAGADLKFGGCEAFEVAVEHNRADIVQLLIDKGFDLKNEGHLGVNALVDAAENGRTEVVRVLVKAGVDIHHPAVEMALLKVGLYGHTEVLRLLAGAGLDIQHSSTGPQALTEAVKGGHASTAQLFIDQGISVQGSNGDKAIQCAADAKRVDMLQLLVDNGANPQGTAGQAAYARAREKGHTNVVQWFESLPGFSSAAGMNPLKPEVAVTPEDAALFEAILKAVGEGRIQDAAADMKRVQGDTSGILKQCAALVKHQKPHIRMEALGVLAAASKRPSPSEKPAVHEPSQGKEVSAEERLISTAMTIYSLPIVFPDNTAASSKLHAAANVPHLLLNPERA